MKTEDALDLLGGIADGRVALKDVAMLAPGDIDAIARVGAAALQGKRFDVARTVFAGLAALDAKNAIHLLHLGAVEHAAGRLEEAVDALSRFIDVDLHKSGADVARALLLRAEILGGVDKRRAALDLTAARALAARSPEARAVVEQELA